jgi:hypothetical protein
VNSVSPASTSPLAEVDVSHVGLLQHQRELGEPSRRLKQNWQHARGERIEGPGMSDPMRAGQAAQAVDHGE